MAIPVADARTDVAVLFLSYLGRAPEFQAMNYYVGLYQDLFAAQGSNPAALENAFKGLSAQIYVDAGTVGEIPTGPSVSDAEYVNWIYTNVLGRAADIDGLAYWVTQLENGAIDRADLVGIVVAAAYNDERDGAYLNNRTEVALEFAKFENSNNEILPTLQFNAADVLQGVDANPDSVGQALDKLYSVSKGGESFMMTSGIDNWEGTSGNDVVTAILGTVDGVGQTLNAFDSLNGNGGNDTLNIFTDGTVAVAETATIRNIETINFLYSDGAAPTGTIDAAKFEGATQIWQKDAATNVAGIGANTTVGLRDVTIVAQEAAEPATEREVTATVTSGTSYPATTRSITIDGEVYTGSNSSISGGSGSAAMDDLVAKINAADLGIVAARTSGSTGIELVAADGNQFVVSGATNIDVVQEGSVAVGVIPATDLSFTFTGATASVALDNLNSVDGLTDDLESAKLKVGGATLTTVNVLGALAEASDDLHLEVTAGKDVTSVTINTAVDTELTVVNTDGSTKFVDTINAAGSTGDISVIADGSVKNITTGAGDDLIVVSRAGATTVSTGAGDDFIVFERALKNGDRVDGGDGFDSLQIVTNVPLVAAGEYTLLNSLVSNIDNLIFSGEASVDAAKLGAFSQLTFNEDSIVVNAVASQLLVAEDDLAVTAAGYKAGESFGGEVTVQVTEASSDLTVNASTVNLLIEDGDVELLGDVQVANVELVTTWPEDDVTLQDVSGAWFALDSVDAVALTTLTVTGSGFVQVDNGDWDEEEGLVESALVTIDVSGLDAKSAFWYSSVNELAETITLGAGDSFIALGNSTVENVDTVSGFKLVDLSLLDDDEDTPYDILVVGYLDSAGDDVALRDFVATEVTEADSLDLALTEVAAKSDIGQFVFAFQGDTYVYANIGEATLDNTDVLVKLVGTFDLDLLADTLNYTV